MLLSRNDGRVPRETSGTPAQARPTLADRSLIDKVLPGAAGLRGGPHPMIFLRAQQQLTTAGSWMGLRRDPAVLEAFKGLVRTCLDAAINYLPPPREEPVVNKVYSIGSDGAKLSGFTLVKLELIRRLCPSQIAEISPSDFDATKGAKDYHIELGSSLQVLAIDSVHNRIWVRYNSRDGKWDSRFAPPGIIANISFLRFDRLVEAGKGDQRRDQVLNELISDSDPKLERIKIRGEVFAIGDQVEMPLSDGDLYKMRILNPPDKPAITLHRKIAPDITRPSELNTTSNGEDVWSDLSRVEHFWCGSGTPPQIGFDPAMNLATIVRFSSDGTVALLRLERPEHLEQKCLALQAGALFLLPVKTGVFSRSAKDCFGLFQDRYLKPWYIRYPLTWTTMPALDRCRITKRANYFDFGPGGD